MFPSQFRIQSYLAGLFSSIRGLRIPKLHRLMVHLLRKLLGCTVMRMKISLQRCNRHFQVHRSAGKANDVLKIGTRVSRPPAPVPLPKRGKILRKNSQKILQKKISQFRSKRNISRFVLWHFKCVQIMHLVSSHIQWPNRQQWSSLFSIWQRFDWQQLHRLPFPQSFVYFSLPHPNGTLFQLDPPQQLRISHDCSLIPFTTSYMSHGNVARICHPSC